MTDPGDANLPAIRIGDAERQHTLDRLTLAHQGGYLDFAEFDERTAAVVTARTQADLDVVTHDLPSTLGSTPTGPPLACPGSGRVSEFAGAADGGGSAGFRGMLAAWIAIALITNVVWFATSVNDDGGGDYWPIWPMIGVGIPLIISLAGMIAGTNRR